MTLNSIMARLCRFLCPIASLYLCASTSLGANYQLPLQNYGEQQARQLTQQYLKAYGTGPAPVIIVEHGYIIFNGSETQFQRFSGFWRFAQKGQALYLIEISRSKPKQLMDLRPSSRRISTSEGKDFARQQSLKIIAPLGKELLVVFDKQHQARHIWYVSGFRGAQEESEYPARDYISDSQAQVINRSFKLSLLPGAKANSLSYLIEQNESTSSETASLSEVFIRHYSDQLTIGQWTTLIQNPYQQKTRPLDNKRDNRQLATKKAGPLAKSPLARLYIRVLPLIK